MSKDVTTLKMGQIPVVPDSWIGPSITAFHGHHCFVYGIRQCWQVYVHIWYICISFVCLNWLMFVCLDQLCNNKLVGNKSSSLMHLHMFKAMEGRVTKPVHKVFKVFISVDSLNESLWQQNIRWSLNKYTYI